MDGHSGVENRQVNSGGSGSFQLVLAALKQSSGQTDFVIHATSSIYGNQPFEFLESIGFSHFGGQCPFHRDLCFYRSIAVLRQAQDGFEHVDEVQRIHAGFKNFAGRVDELFSLRQQQDRVLREIGLRGSSGQLFGPPVEIEIPESSIPLWVETVKFLRLQQLEAQRATIDKEIVDLRGFLPLLYGTGDALEGAVVKALRYLGLEAERTERGFTADILAKTKDGSRRFGFEVTGINGPIKKASKKLTQVLDFERLKENEEKTVLLANTYNAKPITERRSLEHFTEPVIKFFSNFPVLMMTGWDLYSMVQNTMEGKDQGENVIALLHTAKGVLSY